MGYKQPGYGNGKRSSSVPSSPLNFRNKKKEKEYRERMLSKHEGEDAKMYKFRGQETNVKRVLPSQYSGMSKKKKDKLMSKAQEKAEAAQAKLDAGGKLNSREQRFLDEHNYNLKRQKSQTDVQTERDRIKKERKEYIESGQTYEDQADRFADMLKAMGPDAYRQGFTYAGYDTDMQKQSASYDQDGRKYMNPAYYNRPQDQFSRYVPKRFIEKYPELAAKFNLKEGTHTYNLPQMKGGGVTKLETKGIDQIPNPSKMELKRPVRQEPVVEKKKVVKKPEVKPKPKVTKKKESLYDSQYMVPEGTRSSTTMTSMTDPTHWMEGRSALNFKGRKNKKYKK